MTYKFPQFDATFVNPTIEIVGLMDGTIEFLNARASTMTYAVKVKISVGDVMQGAEHMIVLEDIKTESFDMATQGAKIPTQVMNALNEQFAI